MTTKTCTQCKVTRDISTFINGKKRELKTCEKCRERSRKSQIKRKEQQLEYNREWRKQNKERVKLYNKSQREGTIWTEVKVEQNLADSIPKISTKRKEHVVIDDVVGKDCSKCKKWKPLEKYNKHSRHWDNLKTTCMDCFTQYRAKNKERMAEYNKKYWIDTKEKQTEKHRQWRSENKEHLSQYYKNLRKTNSYYQISDNLRSRLRKALRDQNVIKTERTFNLIGCSISFLKGYLEAKFKDGMTWENYGEWHIDHIKPCSKYDLTQEDEQYKCFHYRNLQPLWASENCSKSNKWEESD
jgi:hypothetical protein